MTANTILHPLYYHDHFVEMTGFVAKVYSGFLNDDERQFIRCLEALDIPARCLYIRMANRKTRFFGRDHIIHYEEIDSPLDALEQLLQKDFVRHLTVDDTQAVLASLPKAALLELADSLDIVDFKISWVKNKLIAFIRDQADVDDIAAKLLLEGLVTPQHLETVAYFLYLYFGRTENNLASFALRDMGLMPVRNGTNYKPRFQDAGEARQGFFYHQLLKNIKGEQSMLSSIDKIIQFPPPPTEFIASLRDTALFKLGKQAEHGKDILRAIDIYSLSEGYECRERLARLLHNDSQHDRLQNLLQEMISNPGSDEEYLFASDFYARKFNQQKTGIYTALLRESQSFSIDEIHRGSPEYGAISHFERLGWKAYHAENYLWMSAFGLLFWDELFEKLESFSSDFDFMPQPLKDGSFYARFTSDIDRKIAAVRAGDSWHIAQQAICRAANKPNGFFTWYEDFTDVMELFLTKADPNALAAIMLKVAQDYSAMRDGYPDLMLVKEDELKFIEIKGEGDQIRRNQLARLMQLRDAGFGADIYRVEYRVDPDQTYVVLDVETTGGRPPFDRVIEVGAVKVRNGLIQEEFQSLINPGRHVPAFITELTGISNDMVKDAPAFADIIDDLEKFMAGSIFVAHNVSFDYGFIGSEFRRLERRFSYPKFCTVAQMRRHYPGHGSYSLGVISREYGIRLEHHHRALDDAKAAAELLLLINEKRMQKDASNAQRATG